MTDGNGVQARLEAAEAEIKRLRDWRHAISNLIQSQGDKIEVLESALATVSRDGRATVGVLDGWKNWAIGALGAAVIWLLLHNGWPTP